MVTPFLVSTIHGALLASTGQASTLGLVAFFGLYGNLADPSSRQLQGAYGDPAVGKSTPWFEQHTLGISLDHATGTALSPIPIEIEAMHDDDDDDNDR